MRSKRHSYLLSLLLLLIATSAVGQGQVFILGQLATSTASAKLPEIVQVRTHEPLVSFDLSQPHAAFVKTTLFNRDARMSISSIAHNNTQRNVTASISRGSLPSGTQLMLNIETNNSTFKGYPGTIKQRAFLSSAESTLITEIGTCFSGKGSNEGYILEYACEIPPSAKTYQALKGKELTVTLTVSADQ